MKTRICSAILFAVSALGLFAQVPGNDNLANAYTFTGVAFFSTNGTTVNATHETSENATAFSGMSRSVWYQWTAPSNISGMNVFITGSYRETIVVYTGSAFPLTQVAAASAPLGGTSASLTFNAVGGTTYRIQVDGRGLASGTFTLYLYPPPPRLTLTAPNALSYAKMPGTVFMSCNATAVVGTVTAVYFYTNNGFLGISTNTSNPYTFVASNLIATAPEFMAVSAIAVDSQGLSAQSVASNITVLGPKQVAFLRHGDSWKYLDDGSDQGTAWQALSFNDAAWNSGPGQLGYGDGDEATLLTFGPDTNNKYTNNYFRARFVATNVALVTNLTSRLLRDDGAVVYINTTEVQRNNMPAGTITSTTRASVAAADDGTTWFPTNIAPSVLVEGTNIVATEVHQDVGTSSDISYDFDLIASYSAAAPPSVSITNPVKGQIFVPGGNITISATAGDTDGTVTNVSFFASGTFLGRVTSAPFSITWSNVAQGSYTLTAVATDDTGLNTTSAGIDITVTTTTVVPVSLIATGSVWRYLDNGSDQGTAWQALSFNDSAWLAGPGQLGYGDGDEATLLNFGPDANNKYITYYFRTFFNVTNVSAISNLTMNLMRDDGAVIYINGNEVRRDNMPVGAITYTTLASSPAVGGTDESTFFPSTIASSVLQNGSNVIAVEIHQQAVTSTDISFDMSLIANTIVGNQPTNTDAPFVRSESPAGGSTVSSLSSIQVTFSEAVSGVNASDMLVNGVPATGLSGSGNIYTFNFTQPPFGVVNITWAGSHGIVDQGNPPLPFDGTASSNIWSYTLVDTIPPVVSSKIPAAGATVSNLTSIQVVFSKNVLNVDASDLLINGTPAVGLSGSGTTYTFSFGPPAPGTANITWAANHGITDTSGNAFNATGAGATWSYTVQAPQVTLVASNAFYHAVPGTNEASSPIDALRFLSFDDSSWSYSQAPFYYDDDGTPVPYTGNTLIVGMRNVYTTYFLRTTFVITNPAFYTNLVLRTRVDDGYIIWLNGVEVRRYAVGAGTLAYNASAPAAVAEPLTNSFYNVPASIPLVAGTNVFAVQMFNAGLTSSDLLQDMDLKAGYLDPST